MKSDVQLNLRAKESQRALIDAAAEILHKSRTDFILEMACQAAENGLAPIFPYTFYHLTHDWFVAADIPVANDTPVHYADAIRCNVRRPPQGSLPLLTRRVSA